MQPEFDDSSWVRLRGPVLAEKLFRTYVVAKWEAHGPHLHARLPAR